MARPLARSRSVAIILALVAANLLGACGKAPPAMNAEALALCHGEPLRSIEKRNAALEAGYDVHRRYDCITKESFASIAAQKAAWDAGHTPAAIAAEKKEFEAQRARYAEKLSVNGRRSWRRATRR